MTIRDGLGLLFVAAGLVLATLAWSVREMRWGVAAALLLVIGLWLIWTQRRADRIGKAGSEVHEESMAWRIGRRRNEGDADGDIDGGLFGADD